MISISFDLSEVRPKEARALSAMLAVIGGAPELNLDAQLAGMAPNAREKTTADLDMAGHLGVAPLPDGPIQPECPLFAGCPETPQTGRPEPAVTSQEPEPVKRKRRTKEQMEADELAAQATTKNPDEKLTGVAADPIQAGPVSAPAVATLPATTSASASEPTSDDLRAALKVYAKVHGMPKAIELIKDFGCERISELETRPITDRLEFMKLASNA